MARTTEKQPKRLGGLQRAADAVKRLFSRGKDATKDAPPVVSAATTPAQQNRSVPEPARITRREADIPLDVLEKTYTPPFTGGKASFRSDGADHQNDQEFAYGVGDERWNDEDRFTNKSGDPRIGTHGRTYEPGEARKESRE